MGSVSELASRLLEMLYVTGWDDGFVGFERGECACALSATRSDVDGALDELEGLCLIALRKSHGGEAAAEPDEMASQSHEVAEIVSLSTSAFSGRPELCWWRYYRVESADRWTNSGDQRHGDRSR